MSVCESGFVWRETTWGNALICEPLSAVAAHVFAGKSLGAAAHHASDPRVWHDLASQLTVPPDHIVRLQQVHGADVFVVAEERLPAGLPVADAVVSRRADVAIAVQAADCVPILMADRRSGAVAAVHAGWRGTLARAAEAGVRALCEHAGTRPSAVCAAIGPAIGPCCYTVGPEVKAQFARAGFERAAIDRWFRQDEGGRERLDLWAANRDQLAAAGVPTSSLWLCGVCTADNLDVMPSFRREGERAGRIVAAIRAGVPSESIASLARRRRAVSQRWSASGSASAPAGRARRPRRRAPGDNSHR